MAITDAAKEAIRVTNFLRELQLSNFAEVKMYNDNQGTGKLAENLAYHSRSKHIDIKHHFIRQALKEHPIELSYLPTEKMVADALTKGVPRSKLIECLIGFGLTSNKLMRAAN